MKPQRIWPIVFVALFISTVEGPGAILVGTNSAWRYFKGTTEASNPTNAWRELNFDDSAWSQGSAPFHYGTNQAAGDDALMSGTILGDMNGGYTCVFLRQSFTIEDTNALRTLQMILSYDDGVAIWINGQLTRPPFSLSSLAYNSRALFSREALVTDINLDAARSLLRTGPNVLCLQAFNVSANDQDFRIEAELLAAPTSISFRSASQSVSESTNKVAVEVTRSGDLDRESTVEWFTMDGTAQSGRDYAANSGILHFAVGEFNRTLTILLFNDGLVEGDEQFAVVLNHPDAASLVTPQRQISVRIVDNDFGVRLAAASYTVAEDAASVMVEVQRNDDPLEEVAVEWATADGSAQAGSDYQGGSGTLNFAVGEVRKEIAIPLLNDGKTEGLETFLLRLRAVTEGTSLGVVTQALVRIEDNDLGIGFERPDYRLPEYDRILRVPVRRNDDSSLPATVDVGTTGQTAIAGQDYELSTQSLTFARGQKTAEILVRIIDDAAEEPAETFTLELSHATGDASVGGAATTTVTIVASDRQTRHVWTGSPKPTAPFTSWATAAHVIQDAVDAAEEGDVVLVTNGVYAAGLNSLVDGDPSRVSLPGATVLMSVNGPRATAIVGASRWDGEANDSTDVRCVEVGAAAIVCGFTLTNGHAFVGGGAWCEPSGSLFNCILTRNFADAGAGVYRGELEHCTVAGNVGDLAAIEARLYGCIVYSNDSIRGDNYENCEFAFSCSSPLPPGPGNVDADPEFRDGAAGDYRLRANSPSIDATSPIDSTLRPIDGDGDGVARADQGALEYYPLRFGEDLHLNASGFHCAIQGEPGTVVRLERSVDFSSWNLVNEMTLPLTGETTGHDTTAQNQSWRVYRLVSSP